MSLSLRRSASVRSHLSLMEATHRPRTCFSSLLATDSLNRRLASKLALIAATETAKAEMEMELQTSRHVFMASVSHEIRTPCGSIVGALGVLRGTRLGPLQLEMCDIIATGSSEILTLVEDALSVDLAQTTGFEARLRAWLIAPQSLLRAPFIP